MHNSHFYRIAITPPEISTGEADYITVILDAGWDYVHLRHPKASTSEVRRIIESIPQQHHRRLKLHGHFELINEFNLGGLHLNHRCPAPPALYSGALSKSCHSIEETADIGRYEYVTLSPIFDSISKTGYKAAFTDRALTEIPPSKVIALGGITPERLHDVMQYPFSGIAVLGYLFNATDSKNLRQRIAEFETKLNR
ncbi:MAG: thiamine phosphate synthase [Muribaculaceae bacterium]|nr:thiamine phosphate synthase [Muribaculaceae bacterium]